MNRRSMLSIALAAIAALALGIGALAVVTLWRLNLSSAMFGLVGGLLAAGVLLSFAAWILGLMAAARASRWDWLLAVLLLGPLGALLYGIYGFTNSVEQAAIAG